VVNGHGTQPVGGARRVLIGANLNGANSTMTVVVRTAQASNPSTFSGPHPVGSTVQVGKTADGTTFVTIDSVDPPKS
jgi:hypothetical protein